MHGRKTDKFNYEKFSFTKGEKIKWQIKNMLISRAKNPCK